MEWRRLTVAIDVASGHYTIARPGITLWLTYTTPIQELGPCIADALERYLDLIGPETFDHYLSANGTYKKFSAAVLTRTLKRLRSVSSDTEFEEFHFGQGPGGGVSNYGAHFKGSNLANTEDLPLETNLLLLEFPVEQLDITPADDFIRFAAEVADLAELNSGVGGYAFKRPQMAFEPEATEAIAHMALRYIGLDISYESIRDDLKGAVHNVSWLTLLGQPLVHKLGGLDKLRKALSSELSLIELNQGILIRAGMSPPIGDVNRGATDVNLLRELAALTKSIRVDTDYLGSDNDLFAERWLSRLD